MNSNSPRFVWDRRLSRAEQRAAMRDANRPEHDMLLALLLREARPYEV